MALFSFLTLFLFSFLATICKGEYCLSLQDWSSNLILNYGWAYDGECGHAFQNPTDAAGLIPFYALRSPASDDYRELAYFYTWDEGEKAAFLANPNWVLEETWYVYGSSVAGSQALHRLYQPTNGDHIWSVNDEEVQQLQTPEGGSWRYEGPAAFLPPPPPSPWSTAPPVNGPQPAPMSRYKLIQRPPIYCMLFDPHYTQLTYKGKRN